MHDFIARWANLESIFVGSLDIRSQLPADSARFDAINTDFQVSADVTAAALQCNSPLRVMSLGHGKNL